MRRLLALLAFVVGTACNDSNAGLTATGIAGTYHLTTVNGAALPFVLQAASPKRELLSDVFNLFAAGTFTRNTNVRVTDGNVVSTQTLSDGGTFAVRDGVAEFRFTSDSSTATAAIAPNSLIVTDGARSSVYVKE